jgi:6-pyruvoyltetrahydropterin/6-carboxytetrahydropterin synthase
VSLIVSKRFEFSASHRCARNEWNNDENRAQYADESRGEFGHGHNYQLYAGVSGGIDSDTGMIVNVADLKRHFNVILSDRYDHRFLNVDHPDFVDAVPTAEMVARSLMNDLVEISSELIVSPALVHLVQSDQDEATVFPDSRIERHCNRSFSAARRTFSPHLSDRENDKLFGVAASKAGHGHGYRMQVTIGGELDRDTGLFLPEPDLAAAIGAVVADLDHKHLNRELSDYPNIPMTTECLARYIFDRLAVSIPIERIRLAENDNFAVEYDRRKRFTLSIRQSFFAAHRLHGRKLSNEENRRVFDKCNHPAGHGHQYWVEATFGGAIDERTGALYNLDQLNQEVGAILEQFNYRHLDNELQEFSDIVSTGENIVTVLAERIQAQINGALTGLRLWETPNNMFTLNIDSNG